MGEEKTQWMFVPSRAGNSEAESLTPSLSTWLQVSYLEEQHSWCKHRATHRRKGLAGSGPITQRRDSENWEAARTHPTTESNGTHTHTHTRVHEHTFTLNMLHKVEQSWCQHVHRQRLFPFHTKQTNTKQREALRQVESEPQQDFLNIS